MRRWVTRVTVLVLALLVLGVALNVRYFVVRGESMLPTLESGQFILVERLQYRFRDPRPGEVVVVRLRPEDWFFAAVGGGQYIKRVVAGPEDTVQIIEGQVYVNGSPLPKPYVSEPSTQEMAPVTVPAAHYFLLGDNRNHTEDSRSWGPLPRDRIIGKVLLPLLP